MVALKDKAFVNPDLAVIHAPLAALPVAFPRERFLQVRGYVTLTGGSFTHVWGCCDLPVVSYHCPQAGVRCSRMVVAGPRGVLR